MLSVMLSEAQHPAAAAARFLAALGMTPAQAPTSSTTTPRRAPGVRLIFLSASVGRVKSGRQRKRMSMNGLMSDASITPSRLQSPAYTGSYP